MSEFRTWAPTSPMGWNSWDAFGASVTEEEVRENAEFVAKNLKQFGYNYIVVDIQWYEPFANSSVYHPFADLAMDDQCRLIPTVNRFPSAANGAGFRPLSDYIHQLGLKFGIHMMRGIPRQAVHQNKRFCNGKFTARDIAANNICPWNSDMYGIDMSTEGAQTYYNSLIELYADWGVDLLKVDDICDSKLYGMHQAEIVAIRKAIDFVGRPIVLSLSPGPADLEHAAFLQQNANMWRLTDDFWDTWDQLKEMFPIAAKWAPLIRSGNWPDCDMLPLGAIRQRSVDGGTNLPRTRFTGAEQHTMLTLWAFMKSPLFLGGDLTKSGSELSLIQDKELLEIHHNITESHEVMRDTDYAIWQGQVKNHQVFAYFNLSDEAKTLMKTDLEINELKGNKEFESRVIAPHGVSIWQVKI